MRLVIPDHLQSNEMNLQSLLMKATAKLESYNFSEFRFMQEYQMAFLEYVEKVLEMVPISLSLKLGVDPDLVMKKSFKIPIDVLNRIVNGERLEGELFYKSLFSKLKDKFRIASNFFQKFNFNKGKPIDPFKFKGKVKYNPNTGELMTNEEWKIMTDDIVNFLDDRIGNAEEELVVRAGLMGKLLQSMEAEGKNLNEVKNMSYDEIEEEYGQIPQTIDDAVKNFNLSSPERSAIEYAKEHAGEHLAIEDGSLKNKIIKMVRKQIVGGLEDGITAQEMISRLYWVDPSDELGQRFKNDTIDSINRDWRRVVLTEFSYAQNNGYMSAVAEQNRKAKKKTYFVYAGQVDRGTCDFCESALGTVMLWSDKPLSDDKIVDEHATIAIWRGKSNVGRSGANWWICFPTHPHCNHYAEEIDPMEEAWDPEINKIVYKIEEEVL